MLAMEVKVEPFGPYLAKVRWDFYGLTQKDLADAIDMSVSGIQKWEADEQPPSRKNMRKLAEAFKLDLETWDGLADRRELPNHQSQKKKFDGGNPLAAAAQWVLSLSEKDRAEVAASLARAILNPADLSISSDPESVARRALAKLRKPPHGTDKDQK